MDTIMGTIMGLGTGIDEAMKAADEAYEKVTNLHAGITSEISKAQDIVKDISTNAELKFVQVEAEEQKVQLGNLNEQVKKSVDRLEQKRIESFKIDKIELIKTHYKNVEEKIVTTGLEGDEGSIEISSGLNEGDVVITSSN